jgi:hypothetical protein
VASDTPVCCRRLPGQPDGAVHGVLVRWTLRRTGPRVGRPRRPAQRRGRLGRGHDGHRCRGAAADPPGDQIGLHAARRHAGRVQRLTLLVTGVIEPDADNDGYGDETQDACPAEASLHVAPCNADVALAMAGPAFGVVDRDTPYVVTVANRGPSAAAA